MKDQNEMVLQIINCLTEVAGVAPCKKKLQKIVYLIEQKNIDLGFPYKIYIYGPYSEDLDYTICELKAEHSLEITYGNKGHILECIKQLGQNTISQDIVQIIRAFGKKSAKELELISTALYAERYIENKNDQGIMQAVHKIKKNKFSSVEVGEAIQLLKEMDYIPAEV